MEIKFFVYTFWIFLLILSFCYLLFRKILPRYKLFSFDTSLSDIILTLTAMINTELQLWENDIFKENQGIGNNAQYENFYNEICSSIIDSLSETFFENAEKYMQRDAVITIIARRVKNFLNEHVQTPFPDPSSKMIFEDDM